MSEVVGLFGAAIKMPLLLLSSVARLFAAVVDSWIDRPLVATPASPSQQTGNGREDTNDRSDLGGRDLKFVGYALLFTKPDLEVVLEARSDKNLINYATDGASYRALKTAEFFQRVRRGSVPRPPLWVEASYPPGARGRYRWTIPREDLRYVAFDYGVRLRLPKSPEEYEKLRTRALEQIARTLGQPPP